MKIESIPIKEIIDFIKNDIISVFGNIDNVCIDNLSAAEEVNETTLDWVNPIKVSKQLLVEKTKARVILTDTTVVYSESIQNANKVLIAVNNPREILVNIGNRFFRKQIFPAIHPTAMIHPNTKIGNNVFIGAYCNIGDCEIGDESIIHPNVTLYDRTIIGKHTVIHSGVVICSDGLGCTRNPNGSLIEFPQLGRVIIGDNVYLGANTQIASGALSDTIIGDGCKINGLCFIGSNCKLGKNVWITGSTMLSGSVIVGDNVTLYSRVVIREHIHIGNNSIIGMGSVITKNIPENEIWYGNPAKAIKKTK